MKIREIRKRAAILLAAALTAGQCVPAQALDEGMKAQLEAVKSLAEMDLEANSAAIGILLGQCIGLLADDDPAKGTLQSIQTLLESGNANAVSVNVLLDSLLAEDTQGDSSQEDAQGGPSQEDAQGGSSQEDAQGGSSQGGAQGGLVFPDANALFQAALPGDVELPAFEVADFAQTHIPTSVLVDVPSDWGNNAAGGRSLISYSPVNGSGAINPKAGTLTLSYFAVESGDPEATFADYEKSIADMSVTSNMQSEDVSAANFPARKLNFQMSVGAHQFTCETICFVYEETVYAIELMQGQLSSYNYFPVFGQVVQSAEIVGEDMPVIPAETEPAAPAETEQAAPAETEQAAPEETEQTAPAETEQAAPAETEQTAPAETEQAAPAETEQSAPEETEPAAPAETEQAAPGGTESISSFQYELNGHTYQFPTPVSEIAPSDLNLDRQLDLPYDMSSDADMDSGSWTEIVNTEYFYFENSLYKEMTGITNMTGYDTTLSEGILTALIDTNGSYLNVNLPGDVHVGSAEQDILRGFPQFSDRVLDGTAAFIGNDYLYACNVRDDGCNGYVIIRNDDPFYSAVSIICEDSVIKEISFECLGSERAYGVFEDTF